MFKEVMGKYPPPMAEVLAEPEAPGETKTCGDLGCGSGSWFVSFNPSISILETNIMILRIIDVARDFPHVCAVAVDLVPLRVT